MEKSTLRQVYHGSLFSGIGGFDLAASWIGWHKYLHWEFVAGIILIPLASDRLVVAWPVRPRDF